MARRTRRSGPRGTPVTTTVDASSKKLAEPTLLLVDDHAGSLHLLSLEVKEWPDAGRYRLELAPSGQKAVEHIERSFAERRPLFVLCDVRMAGLNGIDVLRAVAGRSTAPFRFILTTAGDHPDLREQAFALGVDDFVLKSNQPGVLWETVSGRLHRWLRACEAPTQP